MYGYILITISMTFSAASNLGKWSKIWLETYKINLEHNTFDMYLNIIENHIIGSEIENIQLSKIKGQHLQKMVNEKIDKGLTRIVKIFQLSLKQIFQQAIENEMIYKNVANGIKIPTF